MTLIRDLLNFIVQYKEIIKAIIAILVVVLIFCACRNTWNSMWHEFGANLYHFFNDK